MQASPSLHPSEQTLQAFGNGQLDAATADVVCKHIDECEDCLIRVASISSDGFLDAMRLARSSASCASSSAARDQAQLLATSRAGLPRTGAASAATSSMAESIPAELANHPDYEIRRELGRGGMGVVYLAHNQLMGRDEVLKVMGLHIIERPGVMDRFLREIRAVAQLRHPNIVAAYTAFRSGESLIFAMEYVEGLDLAKMVKARGPMPVGHACYYVQQASLGLQHAHERRMVHRDIKPGNLMLSRNDDRAVIKVLDFGLAKASLENKVVELGMDDGEQARRAGADLTLAGQMLGTPDFIAPEQIDDAQSADIRADIYSLGCTLYYLLSGGPPFHAQTLYDILHAHHSMDARLLNFVRPEVPAELAALVAKMMAKEPGRRFQAPDEVAKALAPFFKRKAGGAVAPGFGVSQVGTTATGLSTSATPPLPTAPARTPAPTSVAPRDRNRPEEMWKSLIDFREAEDIRPAVVAAAAKPARKRPRWFWPALAGVVGFAAILLAAGVICRITTDKGELAIETEDPDIQVVVKQGGKQVTIIAPQTKNRIELNSGNYELELPGDKPGLRLSTEKFTLKRGDRTVVTVRHGPIPGAPPVAQSSSSEPPPVRRLVELAPYRSPGGHIENVAVSPDGRRILASSSESRLVLWDRDSREIKKQIEPAGGWLYAAVFTPEGRRALSAGEDKVIRLWNLDLKTPKWKLKGHTDWVKCVVVSPDGRMAYSTSGRLYAPPPPEGADTAIRVWDLDAGREVRKMEGHQGRVWALAIAPDGQQILSGGEDQELILWDASTGKERRRLGGHTGMIECVAFLPDGRQAASAGSGVHDGMIRLWDLTSGDEIASLPAHPRNVSGLAVSPDGHFMVSSEFESRELALWDLGKREVIYRTTWVDQQPTRGSFTSDGRHVLWGGTGGTVRMYRLSESL